MSVTRQPCPLCAKSDRDKTLVVFDNGNVHCHRCGPDAWRDIKAALGIDQERPSRPVSPTVHAGAAKRWSDTAQALWDRGLPIDGTVVSRYLAHRRCFIPDCPDLRYLPASEKYPNPTMLARVTDAATNEPLTLHMTRLRPDGYGKAEIDVPKLLLRGHVKKGGAIRLFRDEDVTTGLAIAEGIETALTVANVYRPIWATIDGGNLAHFPVLPGIECLTIFADNDAKAQGAKYAEQCAQRWAAAGREVRIATPPEVGDWNDRAA